MVVFPVNPQVLAAVAAYLQAENLPAINLPAGQNGKLRISLTQATEWLQAAREANYWLKKNGTPIGLPSSTAGKSWVDANIESYLNVLARQNATGTGIRGYRAIVPFVDYHSPHRTADVVDEIVNYMLAGKIVILDLSAGPVEVRTVPSERIARQIFERSTTTVTSGSPARSRKRPRTGKRPTTGRTSS